MKPGLTSYVHRLVSECKGYYMQFLPEKYIDVNKNIITIRLHSIKVGTCVQVYCGNNACYRMYVVRFIIYVTVTLKTC
jgi:hypothetical protein